MHAGLMIPGFMELILLLGLGGGGLPLGVPPAAEDPMMARVAPEKCLFYTTWSGMAEADPKSENQLEQLLAEPEVRQFATELEKQILDSVRRAVAKEEEAALPLVDDISGWVKTILTHPTAIFLSEVDINQPVPEFRGGIIVHIGPNIAKLKESLVTYQGGFLGEAAKEIKIKGDSWYQIQIPDFPEITWGTKDEYLIVGLGEGNAEKILARLETPAPKWLAEVRRRLPVERVSKITYLNIHKITSEMAPVPPQFLEAFGVDNVTSLTSVSGLDKECFVTRSLLATDGAPHELLGSLVEGQLKADDLALIPADATVAVAAEIDPSKLFKAFTSMLEQIEPRAVAEMDRGFEEMKRETGIDFRDDIVESLGDTWRIYNSPREGGLLFTGLTGVVDLKDREQLVKGNAKLLEISKAMVERHDNWRSERIEKFKFAGHDVYYFDCRDDDFPLAPAWCITDKQLIIAPLPQNIKAYLSRGKDFKSLATVPSVARHLTAKPNPAAICYCDTKQVFDVVYPLVPFFFHSLSADLHREGIGLRVSMLPSAPAIRKHLRPSVTTVTKTDNGIEVYQQQTLPMGSGPLLMPMFGMVPFYGIAVDMQVEQAVPVRVE